MRANMATPALVSQARTPGKEASQIDDHPSARASADASAKSALARWISWPSTTETDVALSQLFRFSHDVPLKDSTTKGGAS